MLAHDAPCSPTPTRVGADGPPQRRLTDAVAADHRGARALRDAGEDAHDAAHQVDGAGG